jgi:RNA polymerase sigma-70 factor (ECF subfamily)
MTDLDQTLLKEIKKGDLKSFEIVFNAYYSRLCKYAYSIVKNYETSSDIVKDTFIKWWENRVNYTISTSLSGFLFRSVHNNCLNYIQRESYKKNTTNESELGALLSDLLLPVSDDYPFEHLTVHELEKAIEKAVDSLPEQCREIFLLSRQEQLSHSDIAKKLQISVNTVKTQIYRALLKLKEDLKEYMPILFFI